MMAKLKQLLADYGAVAVVIYLALYLAIFIGAYLAIRAGWTPETVVGNAGAWTAAYLVTKITQPVRIAATVALAPLLAKLLRRAKPDATEEKKRPPLRKVS